MNSLIEITAQSAVWAFRRRFLNWETLRMIIPMARTDLSSVIRTESRGMVLIPSTTDASGLVLRERQHCRILSSFFWIESSILKPGMQSESTWPSEQSSSVPRLKLLRRLPLVVTHLVLVGLSLSQLTAALLFSLSSGLLRPDSLERPSSSTRTVVGTRTLKSPDSARCWMSPRLSTRMLVSGTRILGLKWKFFHPSISLSLSLW